MDGYINKFAFSLIRCEKCNWKDDPKLSAYAPNRLKENLVKAAEDIHDYDNPKCPKRKLILHFHSVLVEEE